MLLYEQEFDLAAPSADADVFARISQTVDSTIGPAAVPLRFAVARSEGDRWHCELGILEDHSHGLRSSLDSIFHFVRRPFEDASSFNVVMVVPTGIGAEIGGHAGDATPAARIIASLCDKLVTHPNVVNASDVNEMPENTLYVEGSVLARLLMGSIALAPVRSNRVLMVMDKHKDEGFINAAINSVNAARSAYGMKCPAAIILDPSIKLRARYTSSGRAAGRIEELERLRAALDPRRGEFDAVAISSVVDLPRSFHMDYFSSNGGMVNPWGGVEAMLTHAVSSLYDVPSAHSPMLDAREVAEMDPGVVDPRMAAEAISVAFLQCILKGLMRSPRIVRHSQAANSGGLFSAANVSCLVIPDGCIGLPTLAALHQGIPVIAVRENRNIMCNDLRALPWADDQLWIVENYWEAVGVIASLKAGIAPESARRPLAPATTHLVKSVVRRKQPEQSRAVPVAKPS